MNFDLDRLVRDNIRKLKPYSSARSEFSGEANIFLDANENSFGSPLLKWYNRYPDPLQWQLKQQLAAIKNLPPEQILFGNGSDECIDLLVRTFCEPRRDNLIICPPTYGMYQVYADINAVEHRSVELLPNFQLDLEGLEQAIDQHTKLLFLCSPNNPTGNSLYAADIEMVLNNFDGIVVIDEAYINYSRQRSWTVSLNDYPNLVVMQTFSKAWGLAGLRLGMAFASAEIISIFNRIKPPYNISASTQALVSEALKNLEDVNEMTRETVKQRSLLANLLGEVPYVQQVYPSDANFLLVKMDNANAVYEHLKSNGIIVRNRSQVPLCSDCLRVTVGTADENEQLIDTMKKFKIQE